MDCLWAEKERCKENIFVKDTYRRTGRGKSGFEMHYNAQQCSRKVVEEHGYCWQHKKSKLRAKEKKGN